MYELTLLCPQIWAVFTPLREHVKSYTTPHCNTAVIRVRNVVAGNSIECWERESKEERETQKEEEKERVRRDKERE